MNKTAILSFIIDEVALKCRNVSSNMRKRIHWMLKHMEIIVAEYDERALILNGWVRVGRTFARISEVEEIKKGVSNYWLDTQEHLDILMSLNNEIRCSELNFTLTAPIEVESIESLVIYQNNYEIYSKCSFNSIKHLSLHSLSADQIKFVLTRFKRINELRIFGCSLQKLDLSQSRIKQFYFIFFSFKEPVYLPREIDELKLNNCKSLNLIKAQKVNRIDFSCLSDNSKEYFELTKTLKGVKVAIFCDYLEQHLLSLPSTIRKLSRLGEIEDNSKEVINQFPHLIEVTPPFSLQPTDKNKIRVIEPRLRETKEKFKLRPRKIIVYSYNARQLNNHPELFEKVEWVRINTNEFNLDVLSREIKKIEIRNQVDLKCITLNRR